MVMFTFRNSFYKCTSYLAHFIICVIVRSKSWIMMSLRKGVSLTLPLLRLQLLSQTQTIILTLRPLSCDFQTFYSTTTLHFGLLTFVFLWHQYRLFAFLNENNRYLCGGVEPLFSQAVFVTCNGSHWTYVEPNVGAPLVSPGHPPVSQFQDDMAPNNNPFVSLRRALAGNRSAGIETWAQNLTTLRIESVQTQNQQASPPLPNIILPTF